jgi:hypothetical protein
MTPPLIRGTKEIRLSVFVTVPADMQPEQVVAMLSTGGFSVALGLGPYIREVKVDVLDVAPGTAAESGPRLHV